MHNFRLSDTNLVSLATSFLVDTSVSMEMVNLRQCATIFTGCEKIGLPLLWSYHRDFQKTGISCRWMNYLKGGARRVGYVNHSLKFDSGCELSRLHLRSLPLLSLSYHFTHIHTRTYTHTTATSLFTTHHHQSSRSPQYVFSPTINSLINSIIAIKQQCRPQVTKS